jgi:hypothetical protein
MKTAKMFLVILALTLVALPAVVFARQDGVIAPMSINLKITNTAPALAQKDDFGKVLSNKILVYYNDYNNAKGDYFEEEGSKLITTKFGNKELLQWMFARGEIDAVAGSKVVVYGDYVYVVEADGNEVDASGYIDFHCDEDEANPVQFKENESDTDKFKMTREETNKCVAQLHIDDEGDVGDGWMNGILTESYGLKENDTARLYKYKGGKVDTIVGTFYNEDMPYCTPETRYMDVVNYPQECWGLVEGNIAIGDSKEFEI